MNDDETASETEAVTDDIPTGSEILSEMADISLSPTEHQRVKDVVNGEEMRRIKGHDRRYLIVGAGGESGAATRRMAVHNLLAEREGAVATRLEDFGLTREEIELWIRLFDIRCGRATHIVAVLVDFDGGYVWELGLLFAPSYREKVWVLKRRYSDDDVERERFDNGMAASHTKMLRTGGRCLEWRDEEELRSEVESVP